MRVGPPRRAMLLISCALLATRRPPLWLVAKAADSPRSPTPPIPCAYRHPATRRRAAANHAGSSLSRGCILRSHPLRRPSRSPPAPRPIRAPVRSTSSGLAREAHRGPSSVASCYPTPEAYLPPPFAHRRPPYVRLAQAVAATGPHPQAMGGDGLVRPHQRPVGFGLVTERLS